MLQRLREIELKIMFGVYALKESLRKEESGLVTTKVCVGLWHLRACELFMYLHSWAALAKGLATLLKKTFVYNIDVTCSITDKVSTFIHRYKAKLSPLPV